MTIHPFASEPSDVKETPNDFYNSIETVKIDLQKLEMSEAASSKAAEAGVIVAMSNEVPAEDDPWNIVAGEDTEPQFSELSIPKKIWRVIWITLRLLMVICLLYFFVCSLDVLQDSFQLVGGRAAGELFTSPLITNPVCGLMVGVLVTVMVQSSSTSTSIVVSMVGAGLLDVRPGIPIIMGANIGTTVTNTLVAMTQSIDRATFRRAFAGATIHDAFNWLTVLILLPLEVATGYLYYMTEAMTQGMTTSGDSDNPMFLKVITEPLTKLIVQIDKKVITAIAAESDLQKFPLPKYYSKEVTMDYSVKLVGGANDTLFEEVNSRMFAYNVRIVNGTDGMDALNWTEVLDANSTKCNHLYFGVGTPGYISEGVGGAILLIGSLVALILCLLIMVKILNSLLAGPMAVIVRKSINADFPGKFAFLTGYAALLVGAGVTVLVQSSSVFTSALTPLVGLGVVTLERVYPLTLGSNIGTTITAILAALTADADMIKYTMQISLCHLFFNISGILIWFPIPFMRRVPISIAKRLGTITAEYRWFAIFYLVMMFLLLPLLVFGLSMAGFWVIISVGIVVIILCVFIGVVNVLQKRRPHWLPTILRDWSFLPAPLRSLEPYDRMISSCLCCKKGESNTKCCCCCKSESGAFASNDSETSFTNESGSSGSTDCVRITPLSDKSVFEDVDLGKNNAAYEHDSAARNAV